MNLEKVLGLLPAPVPQEPNLSDSIHPAHDYQTSDYYVDLIANDIMLPIAVKNFLYAMNRIDTIIKDNIF